MVHMDDLDYSNDNNNNNVIGSIPSERFPLPRRGGQHDDNNNEIRPGAVMETGRPIGALPFWYYRRGSSQQQQQTIRVSLYGPSPQQEQEGSNNSSSTTQDDDSEERAQQQQHAAAVATAAAAATSTCSTTPEAVEVKDDASSLHRAVSGHAVEYNPTTNNKATALFISRRRRRRRIQIAVVITLLIFAAVLISVLSFAMIRRRRRYEQQAAATTSAPTTFRESLGIDKVLQEALQDTHDDSLYEDEDSYYYQRALDWIIQEDPMQLLPDASNLVQRFVLAVVYFKYGPWVGGCNPYEDDYDDAVCFWKRFTDSFTGDYQHVPSKRWLSAAHECQWAGLTCDNNLILHIDLRNNELKGPLPVELKYLKNLTKIHLLFNQFTGTIPTEWYRDLKQLDSLLLAHNELTGTLPSQVTQFTQLQELFLSVNAFTGTLHTEYATLTNLKLLEVMDNQLTGSLPIEYRTLSRMESLSFGRNAFTGTIPMEWFDSMKQLTKFRAHFTKMTGTIPENIYNVQTLETFDLYHETSNDGFFTGTLSTNVGKLSNLYRLRLRGNHFEGTIPTELGNLTQLKELWLNFNNFTGTMPEQICDGRHKLLVDLAADCLSHHQQPLLVACDLGCCTRCCDGQNMCQRIEE